MTDTTANAGAWMLCGTCKHWKFDSPDWEFDTLRLGECKQIKMREDVTSEEALGVERFTAEWEAKAPVALQAAKAIAVDGSGYFAAVRCTKDFGCVLHEPKPLPEPPNV